jgi:hypothetical protein
VAVDVVGDAVVVEEAAGFVATVEELVEAQIVEDAPGVRPMLADPPVGGEHLVVRPRCLTVGGEEVERRVDRQKGGLQSVGRSARPGAS